MSRALRRRYGHAVSGLAAAVHAMRVYLGGVDFASVRGQQRLYTRASQAVSRVARAAGIDTSSAWSQIEAEARRQGIIRPIPGQHL